MKFYCKNCKSVFEPNGWHEYDTKSEECPLCKAGKLVVPIPDYETPAQYEKRTGKAFPDNGAVFERLKPIVNAGVSGGWNLIQLGLRHGNDTNTDVVIADPPVPPPDDWKPEVA